MSATPVQNPEQQKRLNLLVQDTLERGRSLNLERVRVELGVDYATARSMMLSHVKRGIGHYNSKEQTYFPNNL